MSLKKYRALDLSLFALILTVLETINRVIAESTNFRLIAYSLSVVTPIVLIVMMRWGWYSLIHAALGGAVSAFAMSLSGVNVSWQSYVIAIVGNLFITGNLLWFIWLKKSRIAETGLLLIAFVATATVLLITGQTLAMLCIGYPFGQSFITSMAANLFNAVVTIIILFIARKQNGLFEDQIEYLKRTQDEGGDKGEG